MNIIIGDLINQTSFTHYTPSLQVRFAAPKGRVAVMLLLGDTDKKAPETFDATAALNRLGWIAETELEDAQSQLAALREELANLRIASSEAHALIESYEASKKGMRQRLADAERRNAELTQALERGKLWVELFRSWFGDYGVSAEDHQMIIRTLRSLPHPPSEFDAALNPNPEAASHEE